MVQQPIHTSRYKLTGILSSHWSGDLEHQQLLMGRAVSSHRNAIARFALPRAIHHGECPLLTLSDMWAGCDIHSPQSGHRFISVGIFFLIRKFFLKKNLFLQILQFFVYHF